MIVLFEIHFQRQVLTAFIPQTTEVLPILNTAELSACVIDPTLTLTGRNAVNSLPSGLTFEAYNDKNFDLSIWHNFS